MGVSTRNCGPWSLLTGDVRRIVAAARHVCWIDDRTDSEVLNPGSKPGNHGVVGKKLLKQTNPIRPARFNLEAHHPVTHPEEGVQINGLIELAPLSLDPVPLIVWMMHRDGRVSDLKVRSPAQAPGNVTIRQQRMAPNRDSGEQSRKFNAKSQRFQRSVAG